MDRARIDGYEPQPDQSRLLEDNDVEFPPKRVRKLELISKELCQARIEALIEEIERNTKGYRDRTVGTLLDSTFWRNLKDKYLKATTNKVQED